MWDKIKKIAGYAWAAPITLLGVIYVHTFNTLSWYDWHGVEGDALVWVVNKDRAPLFVLRMWKNWLGHAIGNVVVLRDPPAGKVTLLHEQKHVDQCMRLGIFQPIVYGLCWFAIKIGCPGSDPYYSNPFEIDARRHANQVIDVEGSTKKMNARRQQK